MSFPRMNYFAKIGSALMLITLLTFGNFNEAQAQISYTEDFEGFALSGAAGTALGGGWNIFVNIYDGSLNYIGGAFEGGARNHSIGSSNILSDPGGQFLHVYSHDDDADGHGVGNFLETNIYQERITGAADVGEYRFSFDHRLADDAPDINDPNLEGLVAFIKIIDPGNAFSIEVLHEFDTSGDTDWTSSFLETTIDASMEGMLVQWGFYNTAITFTDSGVYYDNLSFEIAPLPIPTLSQWGLISLALLILIFSVASFKIKGTETINIISIKK